MSSVGIVLLQIEVFGALFISTEPRSAIPLAPTLSKVNSSDPGTKNGAALEKRPRQ